MPTAKEWKERGIAAAEAEAEDLTLPSGFVIRARRPDPLQLAAWGRLPMVLSGAVVGAEESGISMDETAELVGFMRDLLVYACVEPRISMEPQNDHEIHPRDIPRKDWTFIVKWALRVEEARNLTGFRSQPTDDSPGGDGEDVRPAAIRIDGDRRPGVSAGL